MKNKVRKLTQILLLTITITLSSACGLLIPSAYGTGESADKTNPAFASTVTIEKETEAKKFLDVYFRVLFTAPTVDEFTKNTLSGVIPDDIRELIAAKTISEGDMNPEIGVHLPRFVSINGETIIGYEIPETSRGISEESGSISSSFISKSEEGMIFFCKIKAKAVVVPDSVFLDSYEKQDGNSFKKLKDIDYLFSDTIRVELKYDVELIEENGKLKVLRAIESNIKPGLSNRLFLMNNDNITRLSYLDLSQKADGSGYNNPEDRDIYEAEKAVISSLFNNLSSLDRERVNLLSYKWKQGFNEVKGYLDSLGITKNGDQGMAIIALTEDYERDFPFESLPLRYNMEKIKAVENITVSPHPAYSEKRKLYFVNFDATVQRINGITDEDFKYRYDYLVVMIEDDNHVVIEKIKLNEYYCLAK